jgi:hypothetical protein
MPFKKGEKRPENSGRKKGSKNKASSATEQKAAALGMLPKEFLLHVMNGNYKAIKEKKGAIDLDKRLDAAGKVAPYIHRKMPQVVQVSDLSDLTDDELRALIARAESGATAGETRPESAGGT